MLINQGSNSEDNSSDLISQDLHDVINLTRALISKPSITPNDLGCQKILCDLLKEQGFKCLTLKDSGTENLLALHGEGHPFMLFLGHTDVVPAGDEASWSYPPFDAVLQNEQGYEFIYGRGSADMKGSDAAMTLALCEFVKHNPQHKGTVGLLVTSNEEGNARGGTPFVADFLKQKNLIPDYCLVGEPSALEEFGDQLKIGRRGSLSCDITVKGIQGHVAYPERCDNAAHHAAVLMHTLVSQSWDQGNKDFPPTSFQITNIKSGTGAENVAPGSCFFMCNWRFSPEQTPEKLKSSLQKLIDETHTQCELVWRVNGLPFVNHHEGFLQSVKEAVFKFTGLTPKLSTSGGTSDGRFIAPMGTSVIELGPCGATIHKVDEKVAADALIKMQQVCTEILKNMLK